MGLKSSTISFKKGNEEKDLEKLQGYTLDDFSINSDEANEIYKNIQNINGYAKEALKDMLDSTNSFESITKKGYESFVKLIELQTKKRFPSWKKIERELKNSFAKLSPNNMLFSNLDGDKNFHGIMVKGNSIEVRYDGFGKEDTLKIIYNGNDIVSSKWYTPKENGELQEFAENREERNRKNAIHDVSDILFYNKDISASNIKSVKKYKNNNEVPFETDKIDLTEEDKAKIKDQEIIEDLGIGGICNSIKECKYLYKNGEKEAIIDFFKQLAKHDPERFKRLYFESKKIIGFWSKKLLKEFFLDDERFISLMLIEGMYKDYYKDLEYNVLVTLSDAKISDVMEDFSKFGILNWKKTLFSIFIKLDKNNFGFNVMDRVMEELPDLYATLYFSENDSLYDKKLTGDRLKKFNENNEKIKLAIDFMISNADYKGILSYINRSIMFNQENVLFGIPEDQDIYNNLVETCSKQENCNYTGDLFEKVNPIYYREGLIKKINNITLESATKEMDFTSKYGFYLNLGDDDIINAFISKVDNLIKDINEKNIDTELYVPQDDNIDSYILNYGGIYKDNILRQIAELRETISNNRNKSGKKRV